MDLRAEKKNHRRTVRVANPTSLRAENMGIGSVSSPAGLRAEKDIEKLRGTVQGGWSHGFPSRKREGICTAKHTQAVKKKLTFLRQLKKKY